MVQVYPLEQVARLPMPRDNCAVATGRLEPGTQVEATDGPFTIVATILEGHRFAVGLIRSGEPLLSWDLPFGIALRDIAPGQYVCNSEILDVIRSRDNTAQLPSEPNFREEIRAFKLDEEHFHPGQQVSRHSHPRTFMGYRRRSNRGVGTRNYIVVLGTTSRTSSYARELADRLREAAEPFENIDGVVAVSHTEGGGPQRPNNVDLLLRTLAGFTVHPNVGAVLAVDFGTEPVNNQMLCQFLRKHDYPLDAVLHYFLTVKGGFETNLRKGEDLIRAWLQTVNQSERTQESIVHLKTALQCGGSDAFSGISANPLAAAVAKEVIRYGGTANLAETDELIGAEAYVLKKVRDLNTARKFLAAIERFKARVAWHGHTAEDNPSGGNKFRGLYNIVLKSIGAAMKLHPEVRLDYVVDYAERMLEPGFYFMDSPGNDLESVAGQVASGANVIFFTTGNGSITNFPFVPTIKIMSTSRRYQLVSREMDVNAGAYLDGTPMDELVREMLDLTIEVASGTRTKGEKAGHSQVSIWRDWRQRDDSQLQRLLKAREPEARPLSVRPLDAGESHLFASFSSRFRTVRSGRIHALDQIGLILPTSLCSSQIARMAAERLNGKKVAADQISRFVALPHTEGCGVTGSEKIYTRTLLGYLTHPW